MSINTELWGWPQWGLFIWFALSVLVTLGSHGQKKPAYTYNSGPNLIRWFIMLVFLIFGGFFR